MMKDGLQSFCKTCHKKRGWENHIMRKYGLTRQQYDEMLISQDFSCKICAVHHTDTNKRLAVDHCHETGNVRGLLCIKCNQMIGLANDDVDILNTAIHYLESYK